MPNNIPLYGSIPFHLPIHQLMDYFYPWAITNQAPMNVHIQVCMQAHISFLLGVYLEVDLLSHRKTVCLTLWGTARFLPKCLYHFMFPLAMYEGSSFPIFLPTVVIIWRVDCYHPRGYKVVFPCSFDWHFSDGCWFWAFFISLLVNCMYVTYAYWPFGGQWSGRRR